LPLLPPEGLEEGEDEEPLPPPLPLEDLVPLPLPPEELVLEKEDEPVLEEPFLEEEPEEPAVEDGSGVVAVAGVVGVVAPVAPVPAAGVDTVIVGEAALDLGEEALERPIKTPTPIASSSTPTPAMTVTALERAAPSPAVDPGGSGGAGGVCDAVASPAERGPPSSTLLIGARRSPHSRQ
jgi:hypothetical protein